MKKKVTTRLQIFDKRFISMFCSGHLYYSLILLGAWVGVVQCIMF